jgi:broad specificity phosphatase PhoE
MTVSIVYETHSTTTDNERGYATGWNEGRLSAAGRDQARELGERRRGENLAAVYVSDLGRAIETATIAFQGTPVALTPEPRLRECNYGRLNGMPASRLDEERLLRVDVPFPDGESYRDVVARMESLVADLRAGHEGERVLLISHSAPKWALDHLLHGAPLNELLAAPFDWQPGWEYTA